MVDPGEPEQGNSRQYALRRLRKAAPKIHARVLAGEISAHAGMVEAGFRGRPTSLDLLTRAWAKASADKRRAVTVLLEDEEWAKKPQTWIAAKCAVTQPLVSKLISERAYNSYSGKKKTPKDEPEKAKDGAPPEAKEAATTKKADPERSSPTWCRSTCTGGT